MGKKVKILQIGPYPPPDSGWSVRIKFLKEGIIKAGHECVVLNTGKNRKIKSNEYVGVENGLDYLKKLIIFRLKGYKFHIHGNAQSVKGPILNIIALFIAIITFHKPAFTFHGGHQQLYFPKENASPHVYLMLYLVFLFSKIIICNSDYIKSEIVSYGPFINPEKVFPIQAFSIQYLQYKETALPESIEQYIREKKFIVVSYIVLRNGFYIDTLIEFIKNFNSSDVGFILIGIREPEDEEVKKAQKELIVLSKKKKIITISNLSHDEYMSVLKKSHLYLRTYIYDGVSSSVLEALYHGLPVLASENGKRPEDVITYRADDPADLKNKFEYILNNYNSIKRNLKKPVIKDTLKEEINLLVEKLS